MHLWPGRGGAACVLYLKIENRNSAGIPEGNHRTIRTVQGCSGRAASQNPGPKCILHTEAPGSSGTGRKRTQTARGERDGDGGQEKGAQGGRGGQGSRIQTGTEPQDALPGVAGLEHHGPPFRALVSPPVPHSPRSPHHAQI